MAQMISIEMTAANSGEPPIPVAKSKKFWKAGTILTAPANPTIAALFVMEINALAALLLIPSSFAALEIFFQERIAV